MMRELLDFCPWPSRVIYIRDGDSLRVPVLPDRGAMYSVVIDLRWMKFSINGKWVDWFAGGAQIGDEYVIAIKR